MFERFTERARQVVVLAQSEARELRHAYIGTEHLLLGLLREEEGVASRVLVPLDITRERVRAEVERIVGVGPDAEPTSGQIPFTPRAKRVLELSLREALTLGNEYIGTEHILLGLTHEAEGVSADILRALDVDAQTVRAAVADALGINIADLVEAHRSRRFLRSRAESRTMRFPRPGAAGAHAPCWEYRVEQRDAVGAEWLNELGAEGWELVSVSPGPPLTAIFKRQQFPGALRAAG